MTDSDYAVEGEPIPPAEPPEEYTNGSRRLPVVKSKGRVPPLALEAEEAVLGAMMVSEKARTECLDILRAEDFFKDGHRKIFEAASNVDPCDPITVAHELGSHLEQVGGTSYLAVLTGQASNASNASFHARIVSEKAAQRRMIDVAAKVSVGIYEHDWPADKAREALAEMPVVKSSRARRLKSASEFLEDGQDDLPSAWGKGDEILWAKGEPLLITSVTGLGKTTLAQRVMLARIGFGPDTVLDYPVTWDERPFLYIAADRPRQAKRSLRRMVGRENYGALDERLMIHEGPLDFDISHEPDRLVSFCRGYGCVMLDSLKDVALDLEKPDGGQRVARAFQLLVAEGIDVIALHHDRKQDGKSSGRAPRTIDDVFGAVWISAVCGSVLSLWGQPGDPVVGFKHLKMPASEVNPGQVLMDFDAGRVEWFRKPDAFLLLRAATNGLTAQACARALFGTDTPKDNEVEKARRNLKKLERDGNAFSRITGSGRTETCTYYPITFDTPLHDFDETAGQTLHGPSEEVF